MGGSPPGMRGLMAGGPCQAETLRSGLEKVLRQRKEEQKNHYGHRYGGDVALRPLPGDS